MAAGSIAFIGGELRVGGDDLQRREGNVEFFSRDLLEGGLETLAEFGLAGEYRDRAVGIDPDPGIEIGRRREASGRFWRRRRGRSGLVLREGTGQRETDDQRAAARKHAAAIENDRGVHRALPRWFGDSSAVSISRAARCTARRMRIWVPQRHRLRLQLGADLVIGRLGISSATAPAPASSCRRCNSRIAPPALP